MCRNSRAYPAAPWSISAASSLCSTSKLSQMSRASAEYPYTTLSIHMLTCSHAQSFFGLPAPLHHQCPPHLAPQQRWETRFINAGNIPMVLAAQMRTSSEGRSGPAKGYGKRVRSYNLQYSSNLQECMFYPYIAVRERSLSAAEGPHLISHGPGQRAVKLRRYSIS